MCWALQFQTNHVLTGGALGALDGLHETRREELALRVFEQMGKSNTRRFWLLMKVRTDAFVAAVAAALQTEYDTKNRRRVVGGFRQFTAADIPILEKYYDPTSPGADLFIEALGATRSSAAADLIVGALGHRDPAVREAARKAMGLIGGEP
jgi:hypothetical protein